MPRVDLKGAIFTNEGKVVKDKKGVENTIVSTVDRSNQKSQITIYTEVGKGDYKNEGGNDILLEEGDKAYAKRVTYEDGVIKYYVKRDGEGHFFNPVSMYGASTTEKKTRKSGDKWTYAETKELSFNLYLTFLRTKQARFLTQAERESF